jgi:hypothetical protein
MTTCTIDGLVTASIAPTRDSITIDGGKVYIGLAGSIGALAGMAIEENNPHADRIARAVQEVLLEQP